MICDKRPEQLKMDFALWTRAAVMELIEREFGLKLCVRTVGNCRERWGFTPQKPIKRAYDQRPEAIKRRPDDEYPTIELRAKDEGGEIYWGDDTLTDATFRPTIILRAPNNPLAQRHHSERRFWRHGQESQNPGRIMSFAPPSHWALPIRPWDISEPDGTWPVQTQPHFPSLRSESSIV